MNGKHIISKILVIGLICISTNFLFANNKDRQKNKIQQQTKHHNASKKGTPKNKILAANTLPQNYKSTCPNCSTYFTDVVSKHELAYRKEGIKPQNRLQDLDKLVKNGKLIHLKSNKNYKFSGLIHSKPYFNSKVKTFLNILSTSYASKCKSHNLSYIPFIITSGTRSINSVRELGAINENSIENSAHLKGKTLDISYHSYGKHQKQRLLFIESLQELRKIGECFVKYEKNGCLHITIN